MSTWLHTRLASVPPHKTAALLFDHSEVSDLACLEPYSKSDDFRKDLTMNSAMWVYLPMEGLTGKPEKRRVLLLQ